MVVTNFEWLSPIFLIGLVGPSVGVSFGGSFGQATFPPVSRLAKRFIRPWLTPRSILQRVSSFVSRLVSQ